MDDEQEEVEVVVVLRQEGSGMQWRICHYNGQGRNGIGKGDQLKMKTDNAGRVISPNGLPIVQQSSLDWL